MNKSYKKLFQPAFLICVAVLATAGGMKKAAIERLGIQLTKLPLELQHPLYDLDMSKMGPYKINENSKRKIPKEIEDELGTDQYIQWMLEDTEADKSSPFRYCSLFVTYYTGNPDQVPHIPDICYVGGGNKVISNGELNLYVTDSQGDIESGSVDVGYDFPIRRLVLRQSGQNAWDEANDFSVLYFFKANGKYAHSRNGVRLIMNSNLFGKYSYFSKVEWRFYGIGSGAISASEEDVIAASNKLLSVLLAVLESDHWPDWDKASNEKETN